MVAAIAPRLSGERLSLLVRYGLWALVFDDQLDGPDADPAGFYRLRAGVDAVTAGRPPAAGDQLMGGLARIAEQLSRYDISGEVFARFGAALRDEMTAAIEHALLGRAVSSGTSPLPTVGRHLAVAARTVNYRSFAYALLAVVAGGLSGPALDRLDVALWHGTRAVRLGNDLRSFTRDRVEMTLNVLSLRHADGTPVTRRHVQREIGRHVRAHHDALRALTGPQSQDLDLARAASSLIRSLELSVGLYRFTDLR